ncbi:hypothetical protein SUGI_0088540 [Cryptomeria japonica]|nr:hypothetical protein SUGI_0088540 [Cryptomeria japonica]
MARPGKKGFKVGFVRNDGIFTISNVSSTTLNNFLEWPWLHLLKEWDIQILLLNRGAHFETDEIFSESLHITFSLLHSLYPDLLVLFHNTPPGTLSI